MGIVGAIWIEVKLSLDSSFVNPLGRGIAGIVGSAWKIDAGSPGCAKKGVPDFAEHRANITQKFSG